MKKTILTIFFVFPLVLSLSAQEIVWYYGSDFGIRESKDDARYRRQVTNRSGNRQLVETFEKVQGEWIRRRKEKIRTINDTLQVIKRKGEKLFPDRLERTFSIQENGNYDFWEYEDEQLILEGNATQLVPLHLQDTVRSYYMTGLPESVAIYDNNSLVSNENWLKNGTKYIDDIFYFVDEEPQYNLGQASFRGHMMNGLKESGIDLAQISDRVVIGFTVMEDGSLAGFHTLQGVFKPLNEKLIELIQTMPGGWVPAKVNGKSVRYYMTLPFNFIDRTRNFDSLEMSTGFVVWD